MESDGEGREWELGNNGGGWGALDGRGWMGRGILQYRRRMVNNKHVETHIKQYMNIYIYI